MFRSELHKSVDIDVNLAIPNRTEAGDFSKFLSAIRTDSFMWYFRARMFNAVHIIDLINNDLIDRSMMI